MSHKIYMSIFLKSDIKTIPPFLPTNKKLEMCQKTVTDIKIMIAKYFYRYALEIILNNIK